MANYNLKYNKDDSVLRHVIIGLLADLNDRVYFYIQRSNNSRVKIEIPFYYTISGDDNFLHDNFLFDEIDDPGENIAMGHYDSIPRGVVTLSSVSVDSGSLVNKYVRGNYSKLVTTNEQELLKNYTAEFQMIPINLNFDVEIIIDNQLNCFKITEALFKLLYKNNNFNVEVGHLEDGVHRLASYYKFPEDTDLQKPVEYSFGDKKEFKIAFSIECLSFIPSWDMNTERFAGNIITGIKQSTLIDDGAIPESAKPKTMSGGYLREGETKDGTINPFGPGADTAESGTGAFAPAAEEDEDEDPVSFTNTYSLGFTGTSSDGGNSEYVSTNFNPDDHELWDGFSVSYWVKPNQLGNHMFAIGKKGITPVERFTFGINTSSKAFAGIGNDKSTGIAHGMSVGTWYHWAFTYDGNSNGKGFDMYRNGVKLTSGNTATWANTGGFSGGIYLNGRNLETGNQNSSYNNGWDCNLDEVAIIKGVVPISALYDGTGEPTDLSNISGLVGYWRFTEGTGTVVADLSGNGNHGTLPTSDTGLPTWSTNVPG